SASPPSSRTREATSAAISWIPVPSALIEGWRMNVRVCSRCVSKELSICAKTLSNEVIISLQVCQPAGSESPQLEGEGSHPVQDNESDHPAQRDKGDDCIRRAKGYPAQACPRAAGEVQSPRLEDD